LTHLLLEIHPERRATAAAEVRSRFQYAKDFEMRRALLGRLAFYIHENGLDAGIAQIDAKLQLQTFLTDPEGPYALASNRADEITDELLSVNAETVGLLLQGVSRGELHHGMAGKPYSGVGLGKGGRHKMAPYNSDFGSSVRAQRGGRWSHHRDRDSKPRQTRRFE
jgi:hypothetical protein